MSDLVTLGLKPYDLIWVEGRSAAWRYPSEISELKEYAPTIEEQPYDRFFKKPSDNGAAKKLDSPVHEEIKSAQKTVNEDFVGKDLLQTRINPEQSPGVKTVVPETEDFPGQTYQPQPQKKVFVSMPETIGFSPHQNSYQEEKYQQYLPKPKPVQQTVLPAREKSYSPINIQESDESKLETKYTQSLDDIKEMYINTLVQRKTKNRRKEIIRRFIKPAAVPLLLVVTGVAIGYFITNRKNSLQASQSVSKVVPQQTVPDQKQTIPEPKSEDPIDQSPVNREEKQTAVTSTDKKDKATIPAEKNEQKKFAQPQEEPRTVPSVSKTLIAPVNDKETFVSPDKTSTFRKKDVEVDPTTGERKSVVRDKNDLTTEKNSNQDNSDRTGQKHDSEPSFLENEHKNILDLASVKSNNYIRGAFGGIRGLELTVYNNSNYLLDEVSVELQIMKPSEQPLRTDIITFRNISANGTVTVKVPDSQRGIGIDYRITNVESKQWQKSTAGLQ